ncbi:MAG: glycosyltransferase [Acidobacteria bacterium]|nr:glycosyltransferase [Acidobacteriota bacterium]
MPTRVAIVHDWLTGMRGGERVLEVLCERYPDADLFTLLHVRGSVSPVIERRRIVTSPLQYLPAARRYYREALPIFPLLVEHFDLDRYDVVISSSHCVAKAVLTRPDAVHVCYCHTPMRYAWDQFDAYFGPARVGRAASALLRPVLAALARWDRATADRVQRYVTNSQHVARRIRRYYNRDASVVYPPIDTAFFQPDASAAPGKSARRECLIVSALVPYKRIDIAIDACRIAGVGLAIVGDGPERARLERVAAERGGDIRFLGRLGDADVRAAYQRAAAVLMPGEEDFGIVPLEAQACGRPVVALARGGARETIVDGETGVLVDDPGGDAFAHGIRSALARSFDTAAIRRHAEAFGRARFGDAMDAIVSETRAGAAHAW